MHTFITMIMSITTITLATSVAPAQSMSMPKSMNEFVNWQLDRGACGTWIETGVTKQMWVGIPSGLKYTSTEMMWYEPYTQQLFHSHHMVTEDGRVISTGAGGMYWNQQTNSPMGSGSGYDMGKPYSGTSVLQGMSEDTISWTYTEMSQGQTTTYEISTMYTGPNTRTTSVSIKGGDDEPWTSESTRSNPAADLLKASKLAGTWNFTMPDGTTMQSVFTWIADEHVLKEETTHVRKDGSSSVDIYLMYWDPTVDHIATLYLDYHGTVIHGKVDSITTNGDEVTIVSTHEGARYGGLTMSTQMTQVIKGTTLTTTFQGMSLDGKRHELTWSGRKNVSNWGKSGW